MCPNLNKRKGVSYISIVVKFLGKFCYWVETYPREGGNPIRERSIIKDVIFGQSNHSKYSVFWSVMWDNGKHLCHKINTQTF